jgi:hypothetical protein
MSQEPKLYQTDSFQLASYLLAESSRLITVDRTNPTRMIFIFEDSELREELAQKFISYKALIEPHRLYSAMKDLKQLIHQYKYQS